MGSGAIDLIVPLAVLLHRRPIPDGANGFISLQDDPLGPITAAAD